MTPCFNIESISFFTLGSNGCRIFLRVYTHSDSTSGLSLIRYSVFNFPRSVKRWGNSSLRLAAVWKWRFTLESRGDSVAFEATAPFHPTLGLFWSVRAIKLRRERKLTRLLRINSIFLCSRRQPWGFLVWYYCSVGHFTGYPTAATTYDSRLIEQQHLYWT